MYEIFVSECDPYDGEPYGGYTIEAETLEEVEAEIATLKGETDALEWRVCIGYHNGKPLCTMYGSNYTPIGCD